MDVKGGTVRGFQLPPRIIQPGHLSPGHYLEDIIRISLGTAMVVDGDGSTFDSGAIQDASLSWHPYFLAIFWVVPTVMTFPRRVLQSHEPTQYTVTNQQER